MNTAFLTLQYRYEYYALRIAFISIIFLVLIYCYAVTATIFNIASLKSLEDDVRTSRASLGVLEAQYLKEERALTLAKAEGMGLSRAVSVTHISLDEAKVSFNTNDQN